MQGLYHAIVSILFGGLSKLNEHNKEKKKWFCLDDFEETLWRAFLGACTQTIQTFFTYFGFLNYFLLKFIKISIFIFLKLNLSFKHFIIFILIFKVIFLHFSNKNVLLPETPNMEQSWRGYSRNVLAILISLLFNLFLLLLIFTFHYLACIYLFIT